MYKLSLDTEFNSRLWGHGSYRPIRATKDLLTKVVCWWGSIGTTEPSGKSSDQMWAIFNISSWKAEALLQQLFCIFNRERRYNSQECFFQLKIKWFMIRAHRWHIVLAYNQNREPIFYQLHPDLLCTIKEGKQSRWRFMAKSHEKPQMRNKNLYHFSRKEISRGTSIMMTLKFHIPSIFLLIHVLLILN